MYSDRGEAGTVSVALEQSSNFFTITYHSPIITHEHLPLVSNYSTCENYKIYLQVSKNYLQALLDLWA